MANGSNANVTLNNIRNNNKKWVLDNTTKSDEIKLVQKALFYAGYWSSPNSPDGIYGSYSVAATKGFQFEKGLSTTGEMDKATLAALESWAGTLTTVRSKTPSLTYIRRGTQYAVQGDSGSAITQIRKLLNNKGYSCASTGSFDAALLEQVKKFQGDTSGLASDGSVGQATLAVLENTTTVSGWLTNNVVKLTPGLLAQCGFKQIILCSEFVTKLNNGLNDYGFTTKKKVKHILAQIMTETQYGTYLLEKGYQAGAEGYSSKTYYPYYGGGFIHLTHEDAYQKFSTKIGVPSIMTKPTFATLKVAIEYPGSSAGWFLRDYKKSITSQINWDTMTDSQICQKLTDAILGVGSSSANRLTNYNNISKILK